MAEQRHEQTCLPSGDNLGMHSERPYTKISRNTQGGGSKMSSTSGKLMFSLLIRRRTCLRLRMYYLTLNELVRKKDFNNEWVTGKQPVTVSSDASLDSPYTFYFISCKMKGGLEKNITSFLYLGLFPSTLLILLLTLLQRGRTYLRKSQGSLKWTQFTRQFNGFNRILCGLPWSSKKM